MDYTKGQTIYFENEAADGFYVIVKGEVVFFNFKRTTNFSQNSLNTENFNSENSVNNDTEKDEIQFRSSTDVLITKPTDFLVPKRKNSILRIPSNDAIENKSNQSPFIIRESLNKNYSRVNWKTEFLIGKLHRLNLENSDMFFDGDNFKCTLGTKYQELESFGEEEISSGVKRVGSAIAVCDLVLLHIPSRIYRFFLYESRSLTVKKKKEILTSILFGNGFTISNEYLNYLSSILQKLEISIHNHLYEINDMVDGLYIIQKGKFHVKIE